MTNSKDGRAPLPYVTVTQIRSALEDQLSPHVLEVIDESAEHMGHSGSNGTPYGTHFRIRVHSSCFAGMTRVAAHRMVYNALGYLMGTGIHAITIKASAYSSWK